MPPPCVAWRSSTWTSWRWSTCTAYAADPPLTPAPSPATDVASEGVVSKNGSRSGFPLREIPHERQVAAPGHDQEVQQVHQGEAGREARQGIDRLLLRPGPPVEEEVTLLTLGVVGSSAKENEFRLPLHPEHIPHLDAD